MNNRAIVVVHFGTTHKDTIRKALDPFLADVTAAFPEYDVYEAYSSAFIRRALERKQGMVKRSLEDTLDELAAAGYEDVIVQPTVLMMGTEYEKLAGITASYSDKMDMHMGKPLISNREDYLIMISILDMEYDIRLNARDAFLFMGHGSDHPGEAIYAALDYRMKHLGLKNSFVATVEGYPDIDTVIPDIMMNEPEVVYIIPLMIVAGDHARNDMAGESDESWASMLAARGMEVVPVLKGLGELRAIRMLVIDHIRAMISA